MWVAGTPQGRADVRVIAAPGSQIVAHHAIVHADRGGYEQRSALYTELQWENVATLV